MRKATGSVFLVVSRVIIIRTISVEDVETYFGIRMVWLCVRIAGLESLIRNEGRYGILLIHEWLNTMAMLFKKSIESAKVGDCP